MLFYLVIYLVTKLLRNIYIWFLIELIKISLKIEMKKYLLLIEDEKLWEKFKQSIEKDINTEIISLIEKKIREMKNVK